MSSMKPGNGYTPNGSLNAMTVVPAYASKKVGTVDSVGNAAHGGTKSRTKNSEGPLAPAMAKKAGKAKNGKGR